MRAKRMTILAVLTVAAALSASAGTYSFDWTAGGSIPDNQPDSGLLAVINLTSSDFSGEFGSNPYWVQNVDNVKFTITGGWNGDYKIVLTHLTDSMVQQGSVALLDRMGKDGSHLYGYANAGMSDITLDDTASTAIDSHPGSSYTRGASALASGTYSPQGSLTFDSFEGVSTTPLGVWALYFTDHSAGDVGNVTGWQLNLEVVPEPVNVALGIFGGVFGALILVRSKPVRRRIQRWRAAAVAWVDAV